MALFMRNSMFKRWCRKFTKNLHSARFKEWVKWSTPCPCESHRMSQLYCTLQQTHPACSKWGQSVNSGRWLAKDVITLLLQKWWGHWIRTCHNVKWCGGKVVNFISGKFRPFFLLDPVQYPSVQFPIFTHKFFSLFQFLIFTFYFLLLFFLNFFLIFF